jgi:hypothetical protein
MYQIGIERSARLAGAYLALTRWIQPLPLAPDPDGWTPEYRWAVHYRTITVRAMHGVLSRDERMDRARAAELRHAYLVRRGLI